jgi:hypothetical protein
MLLSHRYKYAQQYTYATLQSSSIQADLAALGRTTNSISYRRFLTSMDLEALNDAASFGRPGTTQWVAYTVYQASNRKLFSQLVTNGKTTLSIPAPTESQFYDVRYTDVKVFILPGDASLSATSPVVRLRLGKGSASTFFNQNGKQWTFTHPTPEPYLFNYDHNTCAATTENEANTGAFINYSPYGTWQLEVTQPASNLFSTASEIRFEFKVGLKEHATRGGPMFSNDLFYPESVEFVGSRSGGECTETATKQQSKVRIDIPTEIVPTVVSGTTTTTTPTISSPTETSTTASPTTAPESSTSAPTRSTTPSTTSPPTTALPSPSSISTPPPAQVSSASASFKMWFTNLEMSAFNNAAFQSTFEFNVRSEVAVSAGVNTQDVHLELSSGSVVVSCLVTFPGTSIGLYQKSTFTALLRQPDSLRQMFSPKVLQPEFGEITIFNVLDTAVFSPTQAPALASSSVPPTSSPIGVDTIVIAGGATAAVVLILLAVGVWCLCWRSNKSADISHTVVQKFSTDVEL